MTLEGFTPYKPEAARLYEKKRWWLGLTMGDVFDKATDLYPNKEALVGSGKRYTYGQLRRIVDRMAYRFHKEGLNKGDTVLLQLPNWSEFYLAYFAAQKTGLVVVLLTVNHNAREISHLANLTRPKGWILPTVYRKTDFLKEVRQVQQTNPDLKKVILVGDNVPEDCLSFEELLKTDADEEEIQKVLEASRPDPGDVLQILPSGGTTGLPKGAPRTHNDYLCNVEYKSRAWDMNVNDICGVVSTVGHNLALLVCVTAPVLHGAKVVMIDSTLGEDFAIAVEQEKITATCAVPTIVSRMVSAPNLEKYDLSSLKKMYVGAAHSAPELVKSIESKLGCRYVNAFGMVEGPCCQSRPNDPEEVTLNTIGRPICPYDDFRTLDVNGKPTPRGVEGELAAKGPGIFTGYFKNPQANETAFTPDGYFRTGDLAVIDHKGNVKITGRIKDVIIRGGENIAAQEVEELISSHPLVVHASAIGIPHADLGEEVCAFVTVVEGSQIGAQDILNHLEAVGASRILRPARIEFVDNMPLTAAGKIDKKAQRNEILEKLKAEKGMN
jgi:2,3-dihydroxybenzoate-AMP ligase